VSGPSIPVVDLAEARAAEGPVGELAAIVDRACRDTGFLAVTGHGIPPALRAAVLDAARTFFALPAEVKAEVAIERSPHHRGYGGFGAEQLAPGVPPDRKETFDIGPEEEAGAAGGSPLAGPNQWPDLPGFRDTLEDYRAQATDVARLLMRLVAAGLGLPDRTFDACLEHPRVNLRLLRYPAVDGPVAEGQLGAGAHTDYGCLTLLCSDGTPGLQVRTLDGTWVDVEVPDDALVVNLGDLLQRWTNDRYRSTPHRVVPPVGRDRYSVPVFVNPHEDTEVVCLPGCADAERPARYGPVRSGEYLASRFADTFGYFASSDASSDG
jgi:isopenicillin N synthase-like dioxygenase